MKKYFLLFTAFVAISSISRGEEDRFKNLKTQKDSAIARATAPINDRYVLELQKLLKSLTASGDLDSALAVREEIKLFKTEKTTPPSESATAFKDLLIGTEWKFDYGFYLRVKFLKRDLEIYLKNNKGEIITEKRKWSIVRSSPRTVKAFDDDRVLTFSLDMKSLVCNQKGEETRAFKVEAKE